MTSYDVDHIVAAIYYVGDKIAGPKESAVSLTDAIIDHTEALVKIAKALNDIAEALKK